MRIIKYKIEKDKKDIVKELRMKSKKVTLSNTEEEKRTDKNTKEIRKEDNIRKEDENGFREYKL